MHYYETEYLVRKQNKNYSNAISASYLCQAVLY